MERKINVRHNDLPKIREITPPPVIVTGMHNSGTSILAKIIHKGGVFMDNSMDHFESRFFSRFINDQIIMGGGDKWAQLPIMDESEVMSYKDTVGKFLKENWIIEYLQNGYDGRSKWGFKDPRVCVLINLYYEIFPDAKLVYIKRDSKDIAASLCRKEKKGVGKKDNFEYWYKLSNKYKSRVEKNIRNFEYFDLRYENLCTSTEEVVSRLFSFIGASLDERVKEVISRVHNKRVNSYEKYRSSNRWINRSIIEDLKNSIRKIYT